MEFVLLIIAGVVMYYLYISLQDYLKNPLRAESSQANIPKNDDMIDVDAQESEPGNAFLESELGSVLGIVKSLPNRSNISFIYDAVIAKVVDDYYSLPYVNKNSNDRQNALNFLSEELEQLDGAHLGKALLNATYGEYKKRLKIVEFILMLLYVDGEIDSKKRNFLLDIASELELDNSDFNALYNRYEEKFESADSKIIDIADTEDEVQKNIINIFEMATQSISLIMYALNLRAIYNKRAQSLLIKPNKEAVEK